MKPNSRKLIAIACLGLALAITLMVLLDAFRISALAGESHVIELRGAAYGDVLGFGFWPTFALTSCAMVSLSIAGWVLVRAKFFRGVILLVLVGFAAVNIFNHHSIVQVESLWANKTRS